MKTKYITKFEFKKATYTVSQDSESLLLEIDYHNNRYELHAQSSISKELREEIEKIAKELLIRKHGVNFAERIDKSIES